MMGNQFHLACWRGDVEKVRTWTSNPFSRPIFSKCGVFGANALHIAVYRGYLDIIGLLINFYVPVNESSYFTVIDPLMKEVAEHTQANMDEIIQHLKMLDTWYWFGFLPVHKTQMVCELAQQNEPFIELFELVQDPNCEEIIWPYVLSNGPNSPLPDYPSHITPLRLAVIAKRVELIKYLLSRGADHTITDGNGNTVLHIAAHMGTVDVVQCLLDAGCSLSTVNENSLTPFCSAALYGSLPIITAMMKSPQFNISNVKLEFAMQITVVENHFHIMSSLVRLGVNVSTVLSSPKDSIPLLHIASFGGNLLTVTKLLEYGADVQSTGSSMQQTALHFAANSGATDIIRPLISAGLSINKKDIHGFTAGDLAVFRCGISFLSALIKAGYDVNQTVGQFCDGNYLHVIVCLMHTFRSRIEYKPTVHHLRALISMGCDMHLADKFGRLPIHAAAVLNLGEAITCLVDCGCAVDVPDSITSEGMQSIHFAALYDSVKAIESLSRLDANLNASCTKRKLLPIHLAIKSRSFKACFKLLELGASPIVSQFDGLTPMHLAALHTSTELIDALADCGCSVNINSDQDSEVVPRWYRPLQPFDPSLCSHTFKPIHIAVAVKNVVALRKLLTLGAEVDAVCLNATPLHLASAIGFTEGVNVLSVFKANPNQPGPGGFTPLHLAALYGHVEVVELLISNSCDVCCLTPGENGRGHLTALHLASLACRSSVVETLLEATQTDINQLTSDGLSPLHLALLPVDLKIKTVGDKVPDRRICLSESELKSYHNAQTDTVSLLLTKGCNVNALTVFGHSPYDFAIIYSLDHIVPLLKTTGAVSGAELEVKKRLAEMEKSRKFVQDQVDAKKPMDVMCEKIKEVEDECSKRHKDVEAEKESISELKKHVNHYIAVQLNLGMYVCQLWYNVHTVQHLTHVHMHTHARTHTHTHVHTHFEFLLL